LRRSSLHMRTGALQRWRRGAAGIGLLALLLQFFISFGHVHAFELSPLQPSLQTHTSISTASSGSKQNVPTEPEDQNCPICMVMHMVATGALPAPPTVIVDADYLEVLRIVSIDAFNLGPTRYTLFQTRAPPMALRRLMRLPAVSY
jgi:hypothetical protein